MCKIWKLCDIVRCDVMPTDGARAEGITEAGWFRKDQLEEEVVYPPPIMQYDWNEFRFGNWEVQCLPSRVASF